jgi:cation/acetate symporter
VADTSFLGDMPANWFFGIEPNAFGVIGAMVNFSIANIVSRVTAAPPQEVQDLVEFIRVPCGVEEAHDH